MGQGPWRCISLLVLARRVAFMLVEAVERVLVVIPDHQLVPGMFGGAPGEGYSSTARRPLTETYQSPVVDYRNSSRADCDRKVNLLALFR